MSGELRSSSWRSGLRGHVPILVVGIATALVATWVAFNHALAVQGLGATVGAIMVTGGAALARHGWPRRRRSELHRLEVASAFLLCCVGVLVIAGGVGIYH